MIVCCEGIDASGKSTYTRFIVETLRARGRVVEAMVFPNYETPTGKIINSMLSGQRELGVWESFSSECRLERDSSGNALALQALQTINRYEFVSKLRKFKLDYISKQLRESRAKSPQDREPILVLDRYWASGYAYGIADGLDPDMLVEIHRALPQPDLWIFCDISVEQSFERRAVRRDEYESSKKRLALARDAYWQLVEQNPDCWFVTDPAGTVDKIPEQVMERVDMLLGDKQ